MKMKVFLVAIVFMSGLFFTSCEKDEDTPKPIVTLSGLGYENSRIGYTGADLHVEAEIIAEGKIEMVRIEIHPEEGGGEGIVVEYDGFSGLKNTIFHEHVHIPVETAVGIYHFHLIVTDMEGQQTIVEEDLEIQKPSNAIAPEIPVADAPTQGQAFANLETTSDFFNIYKIVDIGM